MEQTPDKSLVRRYLLGELPEAEQSHVEEMFLADPQYQENVLIAEDELIDDYLDDLLSEQERRSFASHFLATPEQQQKLRIARTLKRYAMDRPIVPTTSQDVEESGETKSGRNGRWFNLRNPLILLPIAAGLLIVSTVGLMKLTSIRRASDAQALEESRRLRIQQDLIRINSGNPTPTQIASLILPPVSVRGDKSSRKIQPTGSGDPAELQLVLSGEEYPNYRVVLRRVESSEAFSIPDLRASNTSSGKVVSVKISPDLLMPGTYRVQLYGVGMNSQEELADIYDFLLGQ